MQSATGDSDHSLHTPLLITGATSDGELTSNGELEAEHDTNVASTSAPNLPGHRHLQIACRILPSCVWAACIFALALFTQDVCKRPLFNFEFMVTMYSDGNVDVLATILNILASISYVLASIAVVAFALCVFSSDFKM